MQSASVPAGVLTNTTRYFWHVRYINQLSGKSSYSAATYFDTPIVGGVITKRAAQAAMILYTDPTQNWNSAANLTFNMLNGSNGVVAGPIMLWFDLGVFQGQGGILASNPVVAVQLNWVEQIVQLNFELHEILAPWNENTVTWDGFVGPDPATLTNLLLGPSLANAEVPVDPGSTCTWAISETVIQNILDGVTTNYGFAIVPAGGGNAQVYSRQNPARAPYLTMDIVPEPLAGGVIMVLALGLLRRRA
ncbi:MAG: DNRLRE domain-containing protein [bacterium]|nr:DNRLRE domain-containing protein [bacterium]